MSKMITKFFPCEVKSFDDNEMIIEHFITTETKDRSGDEVDPKGMILDGIPSVLKEHGKDPVSGGEPVARCLSLEYAVNENGVGGIKARTKYYDGSHLTPPDNTGRRLYEKAKEGYMPYWSIGYVPYSVTPNRGGGRRISKWLCVEYSQVGVPDQVEAKSFSPSDKDRVLDGTAEHREIFGIDVDKKFVTEYTKGMHAFGDFVPSLQGYVYGIDGSSIGAGMVWKMLVRRHEGELSGKKFDVLYDTLADGVWQRKGFFFNKGDGWSTEEVNKVVGDGIDAITKIGEEAQDHTNTKSLTSDLEISNEYRAISYSLEPLLDKILFTSETPSDKDIRSLVKEYSTYLEKHLISLATVLREVDEESKKSFLTKIERKSVTTSPADPAPGKGKTDDEEEPPATGDGQADTPQDANLGDDGADDGDDDDESIEIDGVEIVTDGDSSTEDGDDLTIELDDSEIDELKNFARSTYSDNVQSVFNKLRGRID